MIRWVLDQLRLALFYATAPRDRWGDPWLSEERDEKAQRLNSFRHLRCPTCGVREQLWPGPAGGMSVNVLCVSCGTRYNHMGLFGIDVTTQGPREVSDEERILFRLPRSEDREDWAQ